MGDDVPILGAVVTLLNAMGFCCFYPGQDFIAKVNKEMRLHNIKQQNWAFSSIYLGSRPLCGPWRPRT